MHMDVSRMRRLCKLADAVEAAEARRMAAGSVHEQKEAEAELKLAFDALYAYYLRFPFQIRLNDASWQKARRVTAIWSELTRRLAIQIQFEQNGLDRYVPPGMLEKAAVRGR